MPADRFFYEKISFGNLLKTGAVSLAYALTCSSDGPGWLNKDFT